MSHQAQDASNRATVRNGAAVLLMSAIAALLSGCDSGSGGTDVTIGSGQNMDPVTLDFPVFYVKRPVPDPEDDELANADARELLRFEIGADLFMRDRASTSAPEVNLTGELTEGLGDIRDVDVNYDGTKVVFSMRAQFIENADEEDQPTWNIWEYDVPSRQLRRIIQSDIVEEEGHDIMPHYLPDGRIVFSSTRQQRSRAILLDENKPQFAAQDENDNEPAFVLHVMDEDGTNIQQISFNQSHDLDPAVLADGRIVFTRWEHHIDDNQFDLYTVNPDGSDLQLLYGANSHQTGSPTPPPNSTPSVIQFLSPRPLQDGRTLALIRPFQGTGEGGDLVLIDTNTYVDNTRAATAANIGMTGPAQTRALPTDVRTIPGPSPGGRYRTAQPLFDGTGRLLVSWSQCRLIEDNRIVPCTSERLQNPNAVEAPPLYGIYVYDTRENTQRPIVVPQEGFIYTEVVSGSQRTLPPVILDRVAGVDYPQQLEDEGVGVLNIRSVYDIDGVDTAPGGIQTVRDPLNPGYATRPARFLRVEKVVSIPDNDTRNFSATAFGPNRSLGMREILGYAPIEPDGSVKVKVPADVAFSISVLDAAGRRLGGALGGRHTNWLQLKSGEQVTCNGCHNGNPTPPVAHGRKGMTDSVNPGAPTTGSPFPNTNPALFADAGETMAETRARVMCGGACSLSVDLAFRDYWLAAPPANNEVDACYASGPNNVLINPADTTARFTCANTLPTGAAAPVNLACRANLTSLCRITIHYEQHIHPLWGVDRFVDRDGVAGPDLDPVTNQPINNKCNSCHAPVTTAGMVAPAAGQLNLADGPSEAQPLHFNSYRQLLFAHRAQRANDANTALEDICDQFQVDPVTMVETCVAFRQVPPTMSAGGARASSRFFDKMQSTGGTIDHSDFMSPSELRLLSEWLDIGAQYFNDPFTAPEN
ncbi:PD40 domain-containing protein [Steroidobacter sp. S1-65]|uniref:PD40 domain-containing protein n=1 Tax=Steroidobacter gossypii TaxID=2805490 RepID=A0ABS1X2G9_9GAMM|nr:PD40 domain-containing protein [Steroidobacter gossypii]MBM0107406.1 PD40 domain-containing protein [Steroidobacter gossypii]